jgi:hypothetical protein
MEMTKALKVGNGNGEPRCNDGCGPNIFPPTGRSHGGQRAVPFRSDFNKAGIVMVHLGDMATWPSNEQVHRYGTPGRHGDMALQ